MKIHCLIFAASFCAVTALAQTVPSTVPKAGPKTTGDYGADVKTVLDAQAQAVQLAKQALEETEDAGAHNALETAIKAMGKAQDALEDAKNSPEKLRAALAAEQTAYQALLKATPREYRVSRQRNGNGNGQQANQRQLDQLEMKNEENRYETERQATATPTQQQKEQSDLANKLKELAQRQQDLNERLRELQAALQQAKTDEEREDLQRQLKRLRDEERQMLADVDELRQKMEQSPNASSMSDSRQQLDQTRNDVQRAAQEMEQNQPSQALASGTRAEQSMQNVRDDLRRQTSSQFTDQMRQLRSQARDLAKQEEDIAKQMDSLQNGERKSLDNSAETKQLAQQLAKQEGALTNLLGGMRAVSEQSENVEPLLSQKLYDTLRRADQRRTDDLLETGAQLAQRGFLPQANEVERMARTNINELRQGVEAAAESVLGNETETLRYAQKELDDLTRQMEREIGGRGTNDTRGTASGIAGRTNELASASRPGEGQNGSERSGTNSVGGPGGGQNQDRGMQPAQNGSRPGRQNQGDANRQGGNFQNGNQGRQSGTQTAQGGQPGQAGQSGKANEAGNAENGDGTNPSQQANNDASGQPRNAGERGGEQAQNAQDAQNGENGGRLSSSARLSQLARQLGGGGAESGGGDYNYAGPITGSDYVNWAERMRDVEQVLDSPDLRYQLAAVRERASAMRQQFRQNGRLPDDKVVREQLLMPMSQVRVWLQQELARQANTNSLVPLDRDPVPDNYSELVRKYYEKLGSAQ
jgi:hypothetical protein